MKKIVKGNDFTMRVIVNKIVDGKQQPFSLPACEELHAYAAGRYRRYELQTRVDTKDDSVLLVHVEGDKLPLGKYALEVKGKLFGNDWRSNEYCQFALVDSNAEADTEFRRDLVEGEDSVEMDTAIVFLPPEAGLTELADKLKANTLKDVKAELDRQLPTDAYECAKKRGYDGTEVEYYATFTEVGHLKENIKDTLDDMTKAERQRVAAETTRVRAEDVRQSNRNRFNTAEGERVKNEQQRNEAETLRQKTDEQRNEAERQRTVAENARVKDEQSRTVAEKLRADAETKRVSAEQLRVEAETKRVETDKEIKSTLEYVNAQKYIKENEYEREVRAIEAIKNAPKDPTQDVWLDATDGEIKSGPATGNLTKNAITYYYLGKRVIKDDFSGSTKEGKWEGNHYVRHLDVRNWDMTLCADANGKFCRWASLQSLDIAGWSLSSLTSAESMFGYCSSLKTLDTSGWNLSSLINAIQMFERCSSLQALDTSGWNLSSLTNGNVMFYGCSLLQTLDFRKSTFRNVTNFDRAFGGCDSLAELWLPLTFDKLTTLELYIPSWGSTPQGLASLRWTFGEGADDRTAKGLQPCTVRLDASVYDRLTNTERAAAAKKGWTITK